MKALLLYLPIVAFCACCARNSDKNNVHAVLPEITNDVLKVNIIEYARVYYDKKSHTAKNLIRLEYSLSGDTVVYQICKAFDMGSFTGTVVRNTSERYTLWPHNVTAIIKIHSINIGYYNLTNGNIEMPLKAIVDILSNEYPFVKDDYAHYLKSKKRAERLGIQDDCLAAFIDWTGSVDIWTLKFVNDSLISRYVYSEFDGSTRYF